MHVNSGCHYYTPLKLIPVSLFLVTDETRQHYDMLTTPAFGFSVQVETHTGLMGTRRCQQKHSDGSQFLKTNSEAH